jgi:hypothetical protein
MHHFTTVTQCNMMHQNPRYAWDVGDKKSDARERGGKHTEAASPTIVQIHPRREPGTKRVGGERYRFR